MVSHLEPMLIQNRLADLSSSQEGIQALSALFIRFHDDSTRIIDIWFTRFKEATAKKRLTYMYLCNDIVQTCKQTHGADIYKERFKDILPEISALVSATPIKSKIERIYAIWCERNIFEHDFTDELVAILNNRPKSSYHEVNPRPDDDLPEFEVDVVVKSIDQFLKLSDEVELKRRKLVCCSVDASDLDKVLPILKDKESANAFQVQFDESYSCMTDYISALEKDIEQRVTLIDSLHSAQKYYSEQYKDARIIMSAYKNFTRRVKKQDHRVKVHMRHLLRRKQHELKQLQIAQPDSPKKPPQPSYSPTNDDDVAIVFDDEANPSPPPPLPPPSPSTPQPPDQDDDEVVPPYEPIVGPIPPYNPDEALAAFKMQSTSAENTHQVEEAAGGGGEGGDEGEGVGPADVFMISDDMEPIMSDNEEDMDLSDGDSPEMPSSPIPTEMPTSPIRSPISQLDVNTFKNSGQMSSFLGQNDIDIGDTMRNLFSDKPMAAPTRPPLAPPSMPDILKPTPPPPPPNYGPDSSDPRKTPTGVAMPRPPVMAPLMQRRDSASSSSSPIGYMSYNANDKGGMQQGNNLTQGGQNMRGGPSMGPQYGARNMGQSGMDGGEYGARNMAPGNRDMAPGNRDMGPGNRDMGPGNRDMGPGNRDMAPGNRDMAPGNRDMAPGNRDMGTGGMGNMGPGSNDFRNASNQNNGSTINNGGGGFGIADPRLANDPRRPGAPQPIKGNDPRLAGKQSSPLNNISPRPLHSSAPFINNINNNNNISRGVIDPRMTSNKRADPRGVGRGYNTQFQNQNQNHIFQRGRPY